MKFLMRIPTVATRLKLLGKITATLNHEHQNILSNEILEVGQKASVIGNFPFSEVVSLTKENFESFISEYIKIVETRILPGVNKISSEEKKDIVNLLDEYLNNKKEKAGEWARSYAASKNLNNVAFVQHIKSPLYGLHTLGSRKLEDTIDLKILENQNLEGQEKEKNAGKRVWQVIWSILILIISYLISKYFLNFF
jgi:hypothetical protein